MRLHSRNRDFEWSPHRGPFRTLAPSAAAAYDREGFTVVESAFDSAEVSRVTASIDPLERAETERLRARGGRRFIARADELTFTVHLVERSELLRGLLRGPGVSRPLRRPDRSRRLLVLGPGRLQEAGNAGRVPVAPGQRLHLRRAPALLDVLGGADRHRRKQRVPVDRTGPTPQGDTAPRADRAGLAVPRRLGGRGARSAPRRQHRGLLEPDPRTARAPI